MFWNDVPKFLAQLVAISAQDQPSLAYEENMKVELEQPRIIEGPEQEEEGMYKGLTAEYMRFCQPMKYAMMALYFFVLLLSLLLLPITITINY